MNPSRNRKTVSRTALALCGALSLTGLVYGFVNEAISLALEAATPYVEQGFEVREDNWSGEVEPGKPLLIRHQLFRGNEYWFWAGTSWPGATIKVDIFDNEGNSVGLESFAKDSFAGVRTLPQKTATYFIRVVASYEKKGEGLTAAERGANAPVDGVGEFSGTLDWGLVYGYR
ncbi:MAG: hypothetical protein GXX91_12675 [Verrucomicrobiaceae bacterium]|nr:hypothetical protein [Verrucomicrobiaceae bacterium]